MILSHPDFPPSIPSLDRLIRTISASDTYMHRKRLLLSKSVDPSSKKKANKRTARNRVKARQKEVLQKREQLWHQGPLVDHPQSIELQEFLLQIDTVPERFKKYEFEGFIHGDEEFDGYVQGRIGDGLAIENVYVKRHLSHLPDAVSGPSPLVSHKLIRTARSSSKLLGRLDRTVQLTQRHQPQICKSTLAIQKIAYPSYLTARADERNLQRRFRSIRQPRRPSG
jgi:hypothetical protein